MTASNFVVYSCYCRQRDMARVRLDFSSLITLSLHYIRGWICLVPPWVLWWNKIHRWLWHILLVGNHTETSTNTHNQWIYFKILHYTAFLQHNSITVYILHIKTSQRCKGIVDKDILYLNLVIFVEMACQNFLIYKKKKKKSSLQPSKKSKCSDDSHSNAKLEKIRR